MTHQIATVARYTLLEALRTRLPRLLAAVVVLLGGLSLFIRELALIESTRMQLGAYASGMRLALVFVAGLYVLASVTREFNDKGLDMALALDLPRAHYILGKLAGFLVVSLCLAAAATAPLVLVAPAEAALQWGLSLALELGIVVALALFCAVSFRHLITAASFLVAFYLLARTLTVIRLMSAQPLTGGDSYSHVVMRWFVEGLALLMPALDGWSRTAWLVNDTTSWLNVGALFLHSAVYVLLLTAAAMFDFYRKNI